MTCSRIILLALVFSSGFCAGNTGIIMHKDCEIDEEQQSMNCSHRGFSIIPKSTFHVDTRTIDLSSNFIQRVRNSTFVSVRQLKTLDLSRNRIEYLEPMAFEGLEILECLNLSYNFFVLSPEIFSPALFTPLEHLTTLRLQGYNTTSASTSGILTWPGIDIAFSMLTKLQELFMDFPPQFTFGDGFAKLSNLRTISTVIVPLAPPGTCRLQILSDDLFKIFENITIIELRLTECMIEKLSDKDVFSPLKNLSILDLSRNTLSLNLALESLSGLRGLNMEEINFSGNDIGDLSLTEHDMIYLSSICVRCVDLSENGFTIDFDNMDPFNGIFGKPYCTDVLKIYAHAMPRIAIGFMLSFFRAHPQMTYFDMGGLLYDNNYGKDTDYRPPNSIFNWSVVTLNLSKVFSFRYQGLFILFNVQQLKTLNVSNNIGQCNILEFVLRRALWLTTLDISGMLFTDLYSCIGPYQSSFQSLPYLQEIYISGNRLADIQNNLFINNTNLRLIDLSNNRLRRVPLAAMQLKNLSHLDLSTNAFTHLTAEEMSLFDSFSRVQYGETRFHLSLENNPLQCTCDTLDFINWVYTTDVYIDQVLSYICILSNGSRVSLSDFKNEIKNLSVSCISSTWLIIGVVCFLFVVLLIILFYVVYRYRTNLRYWLYTKLQPPVEMHARNEYVYDAFVAYTEDDYQWIYNDLCRIIENEEEGIKLCIHKRDFTAGKPIHENIVDKMRESRKIILAISVEFLKSPFGPLEIEYAGMKALEEGRDDLIICILLEDIPPREMPKALRNLWHKITFLTWSDDPQEKLNFWQRLRDAINDDR